MGLKFACGLHELELHPKSRLVGGIGIGTLLQDSFLLLVYPRGVDNGHEDGDCYLS